MKKRFLLQSVVALTALLVTGTSATARQRGPVAPDTNSASVASSAAVQEPEVRVVYFSGDVTLRGADGIRPISFGMLVDSTESIVVKRGGAVQIAVDGMLVDITRAGSVKRSEMIRRAKGEKNAELMTALRVIAEHGDFVASNVVSPARVQAAVVAAIAPSARVSTASSTGMIIPLEPRSTAVTRGPIRFRWLRSADSAMYRVIVRDRHGIEVLRNETSDTTFVWESAVLYIGSEYTWTIARVDDSTKTIASTFQRLDDLQGMRLEGGESRIRMALGSENPALPIVLGAHFAKFGCFADAARQFTTAALRTPEHFDRFLRLAREQYASNIGLTSNELEHIQTLGAISMK